MRATRGLVGGIVLVALAWSGIRAANAEATIVRIIEGATAWGAIHDTAAESGNDQVSVVGLYANSVQTFRVSTGSHIRTNSASAVLSIAVNPVTHRLYVAQQYSGIVVFDTVTGAQVEVITPPDGGGAVHDLVVDSANNRLYMLRDRDENPTTDDLQLLALDASGLNPHASLGVVSVGLNGIPWSVLAFNSSTSMLYVARNGGGALKVFHAASLAPVASVSLGATNLTGLSVNPITNKVYVGMGPAGIAVVNGSTNTPIGTIAVAGGRMTCNPATDRIYSAVSQSLHVIDGSTDTVLATVAAPGEHFGADVDRATGNVLVHAGPEASGKIYVIADPVPPPVPAAPTGLAAVAVSGSQVALSWTDNSGNETGFEVQRATGAGPYVTVTMTGPNATTFTDVGLSNLTTYTYRVRAVNAAGESAYSGTACASTPDTTAPVLTAPATFQLVTDCAGTALAITPSSLGVSAQDNSGAAPTVTCVPATLAPGTTTVACTAADAAGNTATASVSVTVLRGAFTTLFLSPLEGASDNLIKSGQTVPVKVKVSCGGTFEAGATVTVHRVDQIDSTGTSVGNTVPEDSGLSNDGGNVFRLADGFYIFNLSTKGWTTTSGARFKVTVRVAKSGHVDTYAEAVLKSR